jgi:hypothetical protein
LSPLYQLFSSVLPRKIVGTLGTIKVLLPSYPVNKCIILHKSDFGQTNKQQQRNDYISGNMNILHTTSVRPFVFYYIIKHWQGKSLYYATPNPILYTYWLGMRVITLLLSQFKNISVIYIVVSSMRVCCYNVFILFR